MKKIKPALILLLSLSAFICNAQEKEKEYNTFNKEITLAIGEDSIAMYAMIAGGKEKKETVIFLHGIPGNERNLDLAQDLRSAGYNSIFFSYRGAWGSQGEYLYSHCLEDAEHIMNYFNDSTVANELRVDTNMYTLIGHSLGGGVALIAGAKDSRVEKIIALSAFNIGNTIREDATIDSLGGLRNYLKSSFMLNAVFENFAQELIDNRDEYNITSYKKSLATKKVLVLDDYDRMDKWPGKLSEAVEYVIIESDHSFTNKRDELSRFIINWLGSN